MSSKKKSSTTLLGEANKKIEELNAKIKELDADIEYQKNYVAMYKDNSNRAEGELASIHAALDSIGVPRDSMDQWHNKVRILASARLFAWLAGEKVTKEAEKQ